MINVAVSRAALAAIPGDIVGLTKVQFEQLLTEAERGQIAERALALLQAAQPADDSAREPA
jgi:hypothetical protein